MLSVTSDKYNFAGTTCAMEELSLFVYSHAFRKRRRCTVTRRDMCSMSNLPRLKSLYYDYSLQYLVYIDVTRQHSDMSTSAVVRATRTAISGDSHQRGEKRSHEYSASLQFEVDALWQVDCFAIFWPYMASITLWLVYFALFYLNLAHAR